MVELSSLLFKPVIERDTSNVVGRIKNAYFSQGCTTIAYFVVSSCKQGCDALLPIADVLCFSDAIVVQNDANVRCIDDVDFTLFSNGIIGMEVYTQNGILKGKIQKVEFAKGGKVSKLCTENEQFTPQNVACVGDVILLKSTKQGKAKKAVIPRPEKETTVLALKENKKKQITDLLMGSKLYNSPRVALRELVQNSLDACRLRQKICESNGQKYGPKIIIRYKDTDNGTVLSVEDNGIGMNQSIIDNYYTNIGNSYYKSDEYYNLLASHNI